MQHTMKRAIKRIWGAIASVWAGIIGLVKRFNWEEARNVEDITFLNAVGTIVFYTLALTCVCAALFCGAWHQLAMAVPCYIMGATLIQDNFNGNEKAVHYFERCFRKK